MIEAISLLLGFQLLGEAIAYGLKLPVPGPVIGMVGLFFAWPHLARWQQRLTTLSTGLLSHLGLLFIPAGVGVMLHLGLIAAWWAPLLLALVLSTVLAMATVVGVFSLCRRVAAARRRTREVE